MGEAATTAPRFSPFADGIAAPQPRDGRESAVLLSHHPHMARIALRGGPDDARFMAAAGRVLDMVLPTDPLTSVSTTGANGTIVALNLGPDEWLVVGEPGAEASLAPELAQALADIHAAVVDVTENSVALRLSGPCARDTLAKGLPLDISNRRFPVGAVAQSLFAKADVLLYRQDDQNDAPVFDIHVRRSFAEYVVMWLIDAGGEYGIQTREAGSSGSSGG